MLGDPWSNNTKEDLYLYLTVVEVAISSVLVRDEHNQVPVYYVNRALYGAELRYLHVEKLAFMLITTTRRLRLYFQAHPIIVLTNQPLREVLQKSKVSGRLLKWAIELGEFDISYRSRTAIKGQVLANFLAKLTPGEIDEGGPSESKWTLHVDGSSTASSNGAGLLLTTFEGVEIEYAIRLGFNITNNEAEYEALIVRLSLSIEAGIACVVAYTDSKHVEGQVTREYEAKENRIKKYLTRVTELMSHFKAVKIQHISRS